MKYVIVVTALTEKLPRQTMKNSRVSSKNSLMKLSKGSARKSEPKGNIGSKGTVHLLLSSGMTVKETESI